MRNSARYFISTTLSVVYFTGQVVLGSATETNFWAERRRDTAQSQHPSQQFAALPGSVLNQLPTVARALPPTQTAGPFTKFAAGLSQNLKDLIAAIPTANGTIQDVYDPYVLYDLSNSKNKREPPVVLIQDVHLNAEAQTNIAALLQQLIDDKKVGVVGVEGAFDEFDFKPFREFPDKKIAKDVSGAFLNNNLLAAPSYVGITSLQEPPLFVGIDDRPHYDANVQAYLDSRQIKERVTQDISKQETELREAKKKTFSPALLKFDDERIAYEEGTLGLGEYVRHMSRLSPPSFVLDQFLEAYNLETKLDFNRVEAERKTVLEKLTKTLSEKETSDLLAQSLAYRMGKINFGAYYQNLKDLCAKKSVSLRQTPAFDDYIRYVLLSDGIKADKLFEGVKSLEDTILSQLTTTSEEKKLVAASTHLTLTKKLVEFSLTPTEWTEYKSSSIYRQSTIDHRPNLSPFERFYEQADIRSHKMSETLISKSQTLNSKQIQNSTALVCGGFHTPQIAQLLREKKISYVVVSPKITKVDTASGSEYLSVFAREKTPLDKLFAGEKLFLALEDREIANVNCFVNLMGMMRSILGHVNPVRLFVGRNRVPVDVTVPPGNTYAKDQFSYEISKGYRLRKWIGQFFPGRKQLAGIQPAMSNVNSGTKINSHLRTNRQILYGLSIAMLGLSIGTTLVYWTVRSANSPISATTVTESTLDAGTLRDINAYINDKNNRAKGLPLQLPDIPLEFSQKLSVAMNIREIERSKVPENHPYRVLQFRQQPIFWFIYRDRADMGLMLDRIGEFVENSREVLSPNELNARYLKTGKIAGGHDYQMKDLMQFFNAAREKNYELNFLEKRLLEELLRGGHLIKTESGWKADGSVIIGVPALSVQELLFHEANHAEWFLRSAYYRKGQTLWTYLGQHNHEDREIAIDLVAHLMDYDRNDEDLIQREVFAYLTDLVDFKQTYLDTVGGEILTNLPGRDTVKKYYDKDGNILPSVRAALQRIHAEIIKIVPEELKPANVSSKGAGTLYSHFLELQKSNPKLEWEDYQRDAWRLENSHYLVGTKEAWKFRGIVIGIYFLTVAVLLWSLGFNADTAVTAIKIFPLAFAAMNLKMWKSFVRAHEEDVRDVREKGITLGDRGPPVDKSNVRAAEVIAGWNIFFGFLPTLLFIFPSSFGFIYLSLALVSALTAAVAIGFFVHWVVNWQGSASVVLNKILRRAEKKDFPMTIRPVSEGIRSIYEILNNVKNRNDHQSGLENSG